MGYKIGNIYFISAIAVIGRFTLSMYERHVAPLQHIGIMILTHDQII